MDTLDSKSENNISDQAVNNIGASAGWAIAMAIIFFLVSLVFLVRTMEVISYVAGAGLFLLIFAGGYGFLGYLLIMQGISANKYRLTKASADFDTFASNYKKFWMTFVILIIVLVVIALAMAQSGGGRMF
jgi:hypothetical protein